MIGPFPLDIYPQTYFNWDGWQITEKVMSWASAIDSSILFALKKE
jgi:hypothetical protein